MKFRYLKSSQIIVLNDTYNNKRLLISSLCLIFFSTLLLLPFQSYASTVYIHSKTAAIYKSPSMRSDKIITMDMGKKLRVIKKKGAWYKVESKSPTFKGWIFKFMVNKKKVTNTNKLYSKLRSFFYKIDAISKKSRRRPSSYTSTAAARGLREKRRHFAEKYKADYNSLEKIERIEISEEEALNFLRQGVTNDKAI